MPRPIRCRRIERLPVYRSFSPDDITAAESVYMTVDEFEALRLLDDEGLTQEACAVRMNIARTTVTSIYNSARKKVADALVHGKRLLIAGGRCEFAPVEIKQHIMEKGSSTIPSLTAKKRRELINKGFLRFLNCPKRSYILLLFLGFPYYSFHADIRQDLIIRSKTCHLMKPVGKVCPGIGRQISLLFTRPVHVH